MLSQTVWMCIYKYRLKCNSSFLFNIVKLREINKLQHLQ